jgi:hypothetical protein
VCVSHRNQAPAPPPSPVCDAPASVFNPIGNEKTRELSPVFLKSHIHLHWLAHLQAATPCEPLRRKPRAIAISPVPNGSCYTAGILHLLEPRRSVTGGRNQIAQPLALVGSQGYRTKTEGLSPRFFIRRWRCAYHRLMAWIPPGSNKNPGTVPAFFHPEVALRLPPANGLDPSGIEQKPRDSPRVFSLSSG